MVKWGSGLLHFQNYNIEDRFNIFRFKVSFWTGNHYLGDLFAVFGRKKLKKMGKRKNNTKEKKKKKKKGGGGWLFLQLKLVFEQIIVVWVNFL